jgi:hypothetical protein
MLRGHTMNDQTVEERPRQVSDVVGVVIYSMLVLLLLLAWVYVPA